MTVATRLARQDDESTVFVVDDDASMREALGNLLQSVNLQVELFGSAGEMLDGAETDRASCLILDVRLPGMSGLDFQTRLAQANIRTPIIFMSGHADIPMSVRAMKAGAVDFLTKPFRDQDMLDAVMLAISRDRQRRQNERLAAEARNLYETLTPREREVMTLVTKGLMNKQVAGRLGLSVVTIKIHRGQLMRKMGVKTLADLVRKAESLGLHREEPATM